MRDKGEQQQRLEAHERWKRDVDARLVTANDVLKRLLGSWCNTPMDFLPGNMHRLLIEIAQDRKEAGTLETRATQPATAPGELRRNPRVNALLVALRAIRDKSETLYAAKEVALSAIEQYVESGSSAATAPDVAERARRAVELFNELLKFTSSGYQSLSPDFAQSLTKIIEAEFTEPRK